MEDSCQQLNQLLQNVMSAQKASTKMKQIKQFANHVQQVNITTILGGQAISLAYLAGLGVTLVPKLLSLWQHAEIVQKENKQKAIQVNQENKMHAKIVRWVCIVTKIWMHVAIAPLVGTKT